MKFHINPSEGVNDIKFGMTSGEVRDRISGNFEVIKRGLVVKEFSDHFPIDYYRLEGILCIYDEEGRLEGMQFYEPSRPTLGIADLLSLSIAQAASLLRQSDPELEFHLSDGFVSRRLNMSIFSPDMNENGQALVGNVFVARTGYFDYLDTPP